MVLVVHSEMCVLPAALGKPTFVPPPLRSGGGLGLMFPLFSQADAEALSESKSSGSRDWDVRLSAQQYGQGND